MILLYCIYVMEHFGQTGISLFELIITLCRTDISNFSRKIADHRPVERESQGNVIEGLQEYKLSR